MKVLNQDNDVLYDKAIKLVYHIKLVQGGQALQSTLRRHKKFTQFLIRKQIAQIEELDSRILEEKSIDES